VNLIDLILPTTDAGVFAQTALVVVSGAVGLYLTRRHPDRRLLVTGALLLAFALLALRTLH
jgi:hypothetical protein